MFPKFHTYTLDNGLNVLLIPIKDIKTIATSLTFDVGYLEETKQNIVVIHGQKIHRHDHQTSNEAGPV